MDKPFSAVMTEALYGPDGYYSRNVNIGMAGDFYTAASASRLFAAVVTSYTISAWRSFGQPKAVQILEFGGGQGELAGRLLQHLQAQLPGVHVHYRIRELSPRLRTLQAEAVMGLSAEAAATLHQDVRPDLPTIMIGNELLDAFPVELVQHTTNGWLQAYVQDGERHRLVWREAQPDVALFADGFIDCPVNGMAEVCLGYPSFFKEAYDAVQVARLLLFDYGITTAEWQTGVRMQGTVRGYRRHELLSVSELLGQLGQADITADVNWDAARAAACSAGWHVQPLMTQGQFLMANGILDALEQQSGTVDGEAARTWRNAFKQLVLPGGMGERFQVLECHKTGRAAAC